MAEVQGGQRQYQLPTNALSIFSSLFVFFVLSKESKQPIPPGNIHYKNSYHFSIIVIILLLFNCDIYVFIFGGGLIAQWLVFVDLGYSGGFAASFAVFKYLKGIAYRWPLLLLVVVLVLRCVALAIDKMNAGRVTWGGEGKLGGGGILSWSSYFLGTHNTCLCSPFVDSRRASGSLSHSSSPLRNQINKLVYIMPLYFFCCSNNNKSER